MQASARATWRPLMLALLLAAAAPASARVTRRTLQQVQRQAPGPTIANWNHDHSTTPLVFAAVETVEDVVAVVSDPTLYPSPLLPVVSVHSVTECNVNDEGTILSLVSMDKVLGLDTSRGTVKVQAGIKLLALHDWLGTQGWEFSFAPEIGDASVGSLVVSTSKDSSLDGPGYLTALVEEVTYVSGDGKLVTISAASNGKELYDLTSSYGTMGIVVEVVLRVRPQKYIYTIPNFICITGSTREAHEEFARRLVKLRADADNLMVIASPKIGTAYAEQRKKLADQGAAAEQAKQWASYNTVEIIKQIKYSAFKDGALPSFPWNKLLTATIPIINPFFPAVHFRRALVNHYPAVSATEPRLDFSYYEHRDFSRFVEVYAGAMDFVRDWKAKTGFEPNGLATYFVERPGGRPAGSNYQDPNPGISYMIDPIFGDPSNQQWEDFLSAFNQYHVKAGAVLSLSQTKHVWPPQAIPIPSSVAHPRLTTKYYKQFVQ
ncbi:hypothetical protein Rsub_02257 [Raphidocelis subcapitata]|uniref:FAD-binding PCMH-type domain-containing protein n=1 Tax=Raphidocelis subcapitata TaxID=307507 RepID=A0A2V0NQH7_9CHLO|nr:hypothetical protein Rsub_02257 [Raphidocelis subcapitata]|eukprot:GBF89539.1 hypothetical protein Rsub_02257 [Raphidocelis subcapitata]